jgi:hypothetical protein
MLSHAGLARVPVLFLVNKSDLAGALPLPPLRSALDLGCASGGRRTWTLVAASAATGEGLDEAASWLLCNASAAGGAGGGDGVGDGNGCRSGTRRSSERCALGALALIATATRA